MSDAWTNACIECGCELRSIECLCATCAQKLADALRERREARDDAAKRRALARSVRISMRRRRG